MGGDAYTLTFGLPPTRATYRILTATATGEAGRPRPTVTYASHQGYATVTISTRVSRSVSWSVRFGPAQAYHYPVGAQGPLAVRQRSVTSVDVSWPTEYYLHGGYRVAVDSEPVGVTFQPWVTLRGLTPGGRHTIDVREVWSDGTVARRGLEKSITLTVPASANLSAMDPAMARVIGGMPGRDRSFGGNELTVAGRTWARGLGTSGASDVRYELAGAFARLEARVGLDDEGRARATAAARFEVFGDGRLLWTSEPVRAGAAPIPVDVDVRGVRILSLRVVPTEGGDQRLHGDWLDPKVSSQR